MIESIMHLMEQYSGVMPERILLGNYRDVLPEERSPLAIQLELRPLLARKLPTWAKAGAYIPARLNLEQCSSEAIAELRADLLAPSQGSVVDITGGLGVDFVSLCRRMGHGIYIEQSPALVEAAQYNMPRLLPEGTYHLHQGDSLGLLSAILRDEQPSLIYADPARREGQQADKRVYAIEDCSPSLNVLHRTISEVCTASYQPRLLVKLSPMLDIKHTLRVYPEVYRVYVLALRGEVKELLLEFDYRHREPRALETIPIEALDLTTASGLHRFEGCYAGEEANVTYASEVGRYVYEPSAAIMKTGLFTSLAHRYGIQPLHQHTHLYTSDALIADFPGRCFVCEEVIPARSSELKSLSHRLTHAEISCRNFPLRPDELRKRLRLASGGSQTLMGTTLRDGTTVLLLLTKA